MPHPPQSKNILANALIQAGATTLYVVAVAAFLNYASTIFPAGNTQGILVPVVVLLLFVISAAVTGSLVLGRSVLWYLDGRKGDALRLFSTTIGALALFMFLILLFFASGI